jgi:hypothetical protein
MSPAFTDNRAWLMIQRFSPLVCLVIIGTLNLTPSLCRAAPLISSVQVVEVTESQAEITWQTNEPATSEITYGLECAQLSFSVASTDYVTTHHITITGLEECTTYFFEVSSTNAYGEETVSNNGGSCYIFSTKVISPIIAYDFESGADQGWTAYSLSGPAEWERQSFSSAHSPSHVWYCKDLDQAKDDILQSPALEIPANTLLIFWHTFEFEPQFDGAVIELSADGGATWSDLGGRIVQGGYTNSIYGSTPLNGRMAWTGGEIGPMTKVVVNLEGLEGSGRLIRFRVATDVWVGYPDYAGWYVDDVALAERAECVSSRGLLSLDRAVYRCADLIMITLVDGDLAHLGECEVYAVSTTEATTETVTLVETAQGGIFSGNLALADGSPARDGILQVSSGDLVSIGYHDADDGTGQARAVYATATVDCVGPAISNVSITAVQETSAAIEWTTDEPTESLVEYGPACSFLISSASSPVPVTQHALSLTGLQRGTTYYFHVVASDPSGNTTIDDQNGDCFSFTTLSGTPVVINELHLGDLDWIELYNRSATPYDFTNWRIEWTDSHLGSGTFTLPSVVLPSRGYLLIKEGSGTAGPGEILTHSEIRWYEMRGGSCALLNAAGQGVDFVRWGNSTALPPAGTTWSGTNPPAPWSNTYGHTLGRDAQSSDTNKASDWENTCGANAEYPTPGARNGNFVSCDAYSGFSSWGFITTPVFFTEPQSGIGSGGSLKISATDNTGNFGFWSSPATDIPLIPDSLYEARFLISTDETTPLRVPQFRLRLNLDNNQVNGAMVVDSVANGSVAPTSIPKEYWFYFSPSVEGGGDIGGAQGLSAAMDLIGFNPQDSPEASLLLHSLTINRIGRSQLQGATRARVYSFETGLEGWTFFSVPAAFSEPVSSSPAGSLGLRSVTNTNTFGGWNSPTEIPIWRDTIYRAQFLVRSDQTDRSIVPGIRLRLHSEDWQVSTNIVVNSTGNGERSPSTTSLEYELYFYPPQEMLSGPPQNMFTAWDILNFDPADAAQATISVDQVVMERLEVPRLP